MTLINKNNKEGPKFNVGDNVKISKYERKKGRKENHKTSQKEFRIEKVIKRKGDKLYVKWKCYSSFSNSWTDKKYII